MGKILPAAFVMLILLLGCTIQDAELPPEPHVPEIGCAFDNPPCDAGYDCVDNECALKPGCMYGNPPCDDNHTCSNNTCELREGCAYGNPPCEYGYACILGKCEGQVFDDDGRLTPYARSFRPEQFSLNLSALPELHPESYGNNYFEPGNYTVRVGDGFGKGDFLVKFVEFIPQNDSVNGRIIYEVFRKERDGNYYHYPTIDNTISRYSYTDMFGITIESPVYSWEIGSDENTLIYHPNCTVFMDYCEDEASGGHYAPNDYLSCAQRCDFDALPAETKEEKVIFSAIYPSGYGDLALFSVDLMKQCYRRNVDFLGFDPKKPRVGMKVYLAEGKSDIIGA
ncbi:TPA: hypothetical protein EYP38_05080, partial [Candidatus Micrarchaeota archaeon]|nr:hypothetical protein [Candidatus Micrarchaeota archaeon]